MTIPSPETLTTPVELTLNQRAEERIIQNGITIGLRQDSDADPAALRSNYQGQLDDLRARDPEGAYETLIAPTRVALQLEDRVGGEMARTLVFDIDKEIDVAIGQHADVARTVGTLAVRVNSKLEEGERPVTGEFAMPFSAALGQAVGTVATRHPGLQVEDLGLMYAYGLASTTQKSTR